MVESFRAPEAERFDVSSVSYPRSHDGSSDDREWPRRYIVRAQYAKKAPSVQVLFEDQVRNTPHAAAVTYKGATLSYGHLNHRANQLARRLIELGSGPNKLIGIYAERSIGMTVLNRFAVIARLSPPSDR